jgi:hypothetical protein
MPSQPLVLYRITVDHAVDHAFPQPFETRNPPTQSRVARGVTWTIVALERTVSQGDEPDDAYLKYAYRNDA